MASILTFVETLVLIWVVSQAIENPIVLFLNPLWNIWKSLSLRSLMLMLAGQMYLGIKIVLRSRRIRMIPLVSLFFMSQAIFSHYLFSAHPSYRILGINIPTYVCFTYNLVFSFSSALLMAYVNGTLWVGPMHTRVRGLFTYLARGIGVVGGNIFYTYSISITMTTVLLGLHTLVFKVMLHWLLPILPFRWMHETLWMILKHFLLMSVSSIIYFFLMNIIDELLIYNSSIVSMGLSEYWHDDKEDLNISRLRFFQISELSIKYPQILRKTVKSHQSVTCMEAYIRREVSEILKILGQMRREKEILDSKMWLSIPQVTTRPDKPKALVSQRRQQFSRKMRSYNFIEIYSAKAVYFWRIRVLAKKYKTTRIFFLLIKNFMSFLRKYEEDYLLVRDLTNMFSAQMKQLHDEVVDAEERNQMNLEPDVFSE